MHDAILLIGPTGSGKTPLGDLLEERGLWDRRCVHFDFGRELRRVAEGEGAADLLPDDVAFVRKVLEKGALLENEHFHIARSILDAFIEERNVGINDILAMNGLPRHVSQAAEVDRILYFRLVIHLVCTAEVVLTRISTDAGGDRAGRTDDHLASVRKKLATFEERTKPLIEHYENLGVTILEAEVDDKYQPESILLYADAVDLPRWQPGDPTGEDPDKE